MVCCPKPYICAISDVGLVRDHNEDRFYVSPAGDWFVVADGMGGHEGGEVAATLAIKAIADHLSPQRLADAAKANEVANLLRNAVVAADDRVHLANRSRQGEEQMGCTIALAALINDLDTCNAGDVRVYLHHGGVLSQITRDHSTVGALVESGQLTPEEARIHPNRSEVLQAVGMPAGVCPDVNKVGLMAGDRILLCSDGLWEEFPSKEIECVLASDGTVRQLAMQLVDRARAAGGHDNITAILCEVTEAALATPDQRPHAAKMEASATDESAGKVTKATGPE
jgi:protein phosphatase